MKLFRLGWLIPILCSCATAQEPAGLGAVYLEMSKRYLGQGNIEMAALKSRRALEVMPDNPEANYMRGLVLHHQGNFTGAKVNFIKTLRQKPDHYAAQNAYAVTLCRQGRFKQGSVILKNLAANKKYATPQYAVENLKQCK